MDVPCQEVENAILRRGATLVTWQSKKYSVILRATVWQLAKPAFGCAAVVKSGDAAYLDDRMLRIHDGFAAERRLRQRLHGGVVTRVFYLKGCL